VLRVDEWKDYILKLLPQMRIVGFSLMKIISVTDTSYDLQASCRSCLSRLSMKAQVPAILTSKKPANCMRAHLNGVNRCRSS
jgi:hypothetical protein